MFAEVMMVFFFWFASFSCVCEVLFLLPFALSCGGCSFWVWLLSLPFVLLDPPYTKRGRSVFLTAQAMHVPALSEAG